MLKVIKAIGKCLERVFPSEEDRLELARSEQRE
jgi:hypothetical protein